MQYSLKALMIVVSVVSVLFGASTYVGWGWAITAGLGSGYGAAIYKQARSWVDAVLCALSVIILSGIVVVSSGW
jgi:hypothetical protein